MQRAPFILTFIVLLIGVGAYGYAYGHSFSRVSAMREHACTMEAKECPDGTYVGRTGPNCEFAACSHATSTPTRPKNENTGLVKGKIVLGPVCPVERIPPDPACSPKGFVSRITATSVSGGATVTYSTVSDANGYFSMTLAQGTYDIEGVNAQQVSLPRCAPEEITVMPGRTLSVSLYCDTGIR
ncbi:MAG: carboxypeptidase regulatory-like domain-containing protein [Patescibacteria group bacterium]|nr:carboxypeptidase regulatory-like domain-containing protein [Patescibacteria group bacterium]